MHGDPYGEDRLVEAVRTYAAQPAAELVKRITESMVDFMGDAPPFDDTTLVVVRYTG
jgi:serine phosphatase RsbU (regulator of sigma subunit)